MASTQQTQEITEKFEKLTTEQARARVVVLPAQVLYECKFALQELREHEGMEEEQKLKIIEPLARTIGWVEALSYVFDTQRPEGYTPMPTGTRS